MNFDPETSESRIITSIKEFIPDIGRAIYSAHERFLERDRTRFVAPQDITHAISMWERNRETFCEVFADHPDTDVRVDIKASGSLYLVFRERYIAWVKKTPDDRRVSLRTHRAKAYARQEVFDGIPDLERFFLTFYPSDDWSRIYAFISYPRSTGRGFLWRVYLDQQSQVHRLTTKEMDFRGDAVAYPFGPISQKKAKDGRE